MSCLCVCTSAIATKQHDPENSCIASARVRRVASLLDKIEQAAASGTPAAQTLALRASFSHRAQSIETTNSFRRSGSAAYRRNASGAKRDTSLTLATGFPEPTLSAKHTHHPQALDETRVIMPSHMPYTGMQSHKPTLPQLRLADDFARTSSGIDTDNTKGQPRTHKHEIEDPVDVTRWAQHAQQHECRLRGTRDMLYRQRVSVLCACAMCCAAWQPCELQQCHLVCWSSSLAFSSLPQVGREQ